MTWCSDICPLHSSDCDGVAGEWSAFAWPSKPPRVGGGAVGASSTNAFMHADLREGIDVTLLYTRVRQSGIAKQRAGGENFAMLRSLGAAAAVAPSLAGNRQYPEEPSAKRPAEAARGVASIGKALERLTLWRTIN